MLVLQISVTVSFLHEKKKKKKYLLSFSATKRSVLVVNFLFSTVA